MKFIDIKQSLDDILHEVVYAPSSYVYNSQKTFCVHVNVSYRFIQILKY